MLNRPSRDDANNIDGPGYDHVLKNNLSYQKSLAFKNIDNIDTSKNTLVTNSWQLNLSLSDSDFKSLDINLLTAPRKSDSSLPDIDFMRPAQGSKIIDAGTDIGFGFLGNAPELGAIEVDYPTAIKLNKNFKPINFNLYQNFPNPFNPTTKIIYEIPNSGNVKLIIYDSIGRKIKTLVNSIKNSGTYEVEFDASNLPSGIYFYQLQMNGNSIVKQMLLLK